MSFIKKKSFGQHFLHEKSVVQKMVNMIIPADSIVEIGPGQGALTGGMMNLSFQKYILAEADRTLFEELEHKFPKADLIKGDAAEADFVNAAEGDWVCVGNLPYNAAAPIITHVLRESPRPKQCLFMIQKEQADRVCAKPGETSMLSLAVQLYGTASKLFNVAPGSFTPPPKVQSTVIEIIPFQDASKEENEKILQFAKRAFQHRRKQMRKTLPTNPEQKKKLEQLLREMNIPEDARPQTLATKEWKQLYREMN